MSYSTKDEKKAELKDASEKVSLQNGKGSNQTNDDPPFQVPLLRHRKSRRYYIPDQKYLVPYAVPSTYDFSLSSELNYYKANAPFVGKYAKERESLDYSFHRTYCEERQLFHDQLIDKFHKTIVHDVKKDWYCESPLENWLVFTAGVMGAGKGHTIDWLDESGLFPKEAFVNVDPDAIRYLLPEFEMYNKIDNTQTGYLTQKEVGYICEVLSHYSLQRGKNVLIDGSLRDAPWYLEYFKNLRERFPKLKLAILHIDAPVEAVIERSNRRAKVTGRFVPPEVIRETIEAIPKSLALLRPQVEFFASIMNDNDREKYLEYAEMKQRVRKDGDPTLFAQKPETPPEKRDEAKSSPNSSLRERRNGNDQEPLLQLLWTLQPMDSSHDPPESYLMIDEEKRQERLVDGWKMIFSDVWIMTCEIPVPWMPAEEEMKK